MVGETPRTRRRLQPVANLAGRPVSNAQFVMDERRRCLSDAGIGMQYADRKLEQFDQGDELKRVLLDQGPDGWSSPGNKMNGVGITFVGNSINAADLHMMTARALHMSGMQVRVVGLMAAVRELVGAEDDRDEEIDGPLIGLDRVPYLFIRQFEDGRKCPLREFEMRLIEELMDARLSSCRPTFPWCEVQLEAGKGWWSHSLITRIADRNLYFVVD